MINWKRDTTADTRTHLAFSIKKIGEDTSTTPLGVQLVHRSRTCLNCALLVPGDEIDGKAAGCMGYLPAAESVCPHHHTREELRHHVSRPHRAALSLVGGTDAPRSTCPKGAPDEARTTAEGRAVRVVTIHHLGAYGARQFAGVRHVSTTRHCNNCDHDGARDAEYVAEGGIEEFGRCLNLCPAADAEDPADRWCDSHQTRAEFDAGVHRPSTPIADA